jgi:hypothetical protein
MWKYANAMSELRNVRMLCRRNCCDNFPLTTYDLPFTNDY